uniref:Uncharacterized protein n=1 Tax=Rhizophora mucronata TaxID=61149 RepID=A0A2P2NLY6_RHIMU
MSRRKKRERCTSSPSVNVKITWRNK